MMIKLNYYSGSTILRALYKQKTSYLNALFNSMTSLNRMFLLHAEQQYGLLQYAVVHNSKTIVRHFLTAGIPADGANEISVRRGRRTLHLAVIHRNYHVLRLLLDFGASINIGDSSNRTPLHYAVKNYISDPDVPMNRTIISHLLRRGADVDMPTSYGETPLMYAIKYGSDEIVEVLLTYRANPNLGKERNGDTALHLAVRSNQDSIVERLLKAGAYVKCRNNKGRTALHLATMGLRSEKILNLLIAYGALVNTTDNDGKTALFALGMDADYDDEDDDYDDDDDDQDDDDSDNEEVENEEQMEQQPEEHEVIDEELANHAYNLACRLIERNAVINNFDKNGDPGFHWILRCNNESIVKLFLERDVDIHCMNRQGLSPLHIAAKHSSKKIVEMLLEKGAYINYKSSTAVTPLHLAVESKRIENVQLLIEKGADINAIDARGNSPLHYIALFEDRDSATTKSIADVLLMNKANPFQKSNNNTTPIEVAMAKMNRPVITALLNHLADLEEMGNEEATTMAMHAINNVDEWMEIYENRRQIIHKMKNEKIYRNISYFDVLHGNADSLVRYVDFVEAFQKNKVIKNFEHYDRVEKAIEIALYTKELKKRAIDYLYDIFGNHRVVMLPNMEMIVENLQFNYLQSFVIDCDLQEMMESS